MTAPRQSWVHKHGKLRARLRRGRRATVRERQAQGLVRARRFLGPLALHDNVLRHRRNEHAASRRCGVRGRQRALVLGSGCGWPLRHSELGAHPLPIHVRHVRRDGPRASAGTAAAAVRRRPVARVRPPRREVLDADVGEASLRASVRRLRSDRERRRCVTAAARALSGSAPAAAAASATTAATIAAAAITVATAAVAGTDAVAVAPSAASAAAVAGTASAAAPHSLPSRVFATAPPVAAAAARHRPTRCLPELSPRRRPSPPPPADVLRCLVSLSLLRLHH